MVPSNVGRFNGLTLGPPLHHYTFDAAGVTDLVGSADGTLFGGATNSSGMLALNGATAYVEFGQKLIPTNNFSVAFFAQALVPTGDIAEIISQGFTYGPGFYVGYNGVGHWFRVGDQWQTVGLQFPVDGFLHHYAVTTDAVRACLYLDGALVATNPPIQVTSGGDNTRLGQQFDYWGEFFHGNVGELWVFSGALTPAEVAQLTLAKPVGSNLQITVSQVRLCWPSQTGMTYQAQYRSVLTTNQWTNLGSPIAGNGGISCVTDDVTSPARYYRVVLSP